MALPRWFRPGRAKKEKIGVTELYLVARGRRPQTGGTNTACAKHTPDKSEPSALHDGEPWILRPYNRAEAFSVAEAAFVAKKSKRTIREWALLHDLGRRIGGQWVVSKVALAMWLDGATDALTAYLGGDRSSPRVIHYFERLGVPLPTGRSAGSFGIREQRLSEANPR